MLRTLPSLLLRSPSPSLSLSTTSTTRMATPSGLTTPHAQAQSILDFWFANGASFRPEWFAKSDAFDADIRERFGRLLSDESETARLEREWGTENEADAAAALALVLLLDQFPRNLFRNNDARAFAFDERALVVAKKAVERKFDVAVGPRALFFYLPFEHAEDLEAQRTCLALMGKLGGSLVDYAKMHYDIIERFGRFPHRNAALGRASTPEEVEFLKTFKGF